MKTIRSAFPILVLALIASIGICCSAGGCASTPTRTDSTYSDQYHETYEAFTAASTAVRLAMVFGVLDEDERRAASAAINQADVLFAEWRAAGGGELSRPDALGAALDLVLAYRNHESVIKAVEAREAVASD